MAIEYVESKFLGKVVNGYASFKPELGEKVINNFDRKLRRMLDSSLVYIDYLEKEITEGYVIMVLPEHWKFDIELKKFVFSICFSDQDVLSISVRNKEFITKMRLKSHNFGVVDVAHILESFDTGIEEYFHSYVERYVAHVKYQEVSKEFYESRYLGGLLNNPDNRIAKEYAKKAVDVFDRKVDLMLEKINENVELLSKPLTSGFVDINYIPRQSKKFDYNPKVFFFTVRIGMSSYILSIFIKDGKSFAEFKGKKGEKPLSVHTVITLLDTFSEDIERYFYLYLKLYVSEKRKELGIRVRKVEAGILIRFEELYRNTGRVLSEVVEIMRLEGYSMEDILEAVLEVLGPVSWND